MTARERRRMSEPVFVDTNVLVYLRDSTEPEKRRAPAEWMGHLWETGRGILTGRGLRRSRRSCPAK